MEILSMYFEFLKLHGLGFYCRNTANQPSDPISSLQSLISMAFGLERELYNSITWRARIKHDLCRLIDQL